MKYHHFNFFLNILSRATYQRLQLKIEINSHAHAIFYECISVRIFFLSFFLTKTYLNCGADLLEERK